MDRSNRQEYLTDQIPLLSLGRAIDDLRDRLSTANDCYNEWVDSADREFCPRLFEHLFWLCQLSSDCFIAHGYVWAQDDSLSKRFAELLEFYRSLLEKILRGDGLDGNVVLDGEVFDIQTEIRRFFEHSTERINHLDTLVNERRQIRDTIANFVQSTPQFAGCGSDRSEYEEEAPA